ncbi:hypothetical protein V500_00183 [Pseudogymnoascus sp. VKM F-4518 (FW-2643)]|nr:hypothetical protein V500_00183 [Pseudogymnoascus sp. VKM F-4518 (FW-2643)]
MSPQPITFPYPIDKSSAVNVDFKGDEYLLRWDGDWKKLPDLTRFPSVDDAFVSLIPHSSNVHKLWTTSRLLKYGADSHIRALDYCTDGFPICKVAINDRQRRLLREEFAIVRHLSSNEVPVVRTHREPLVDEQGIFGFRMERLVDIDLANAAEYIHEIEKAIEEVHRGGVVHHDISPSNLMLNQEGFITVIDFGRAGYIGQEVPEVFRAKENEIFSVDSDNNALKRIIGMLSTFSDESSFSAYSS